MYYRLFMKYYATLLQNNPRFSADRLSSDLAASQRQQAKRVRMVNNEITRGEQAITLTIRMLRELHITFPLHIGFLKYQEDLLGLRKDLAKSMTPLYTLYDKLRNVQEKR